VDINYLLRKYTSSLRTMPDFHIAGTQKGGTTSLAYYLAQHTDVDFSKTKELHFFNQTADHPLKNYKLHFPLKGKKMFNSNLISGESTPDYMIYPQYAELVKKLMPNLKIVVLLKNPVDRAISHYKHNLMMSREWMSIEDALEIEDKRINLDYIDLLSSNKDAIKNYSNFSYKAKGLYYQQIEWLYEHFPKDQIMIIQSEEFFKNTLPVYNSVLEFLQLKSVEGIDFEPKNVAKVKKEINQSVRDGLKTYFEPFNEKLYTLIGKRYDW
jgi:hypothetical protein